MPIFKRVSTMLLWFELYLATVLLLRLEYCSFTEPLVRTGLPPPLCGEDGYYYHYPGLITSIPTIGNVSGYERVFVVQKNNTRCFTKDYFVDVPYGLYPGETFRVLILADEFLITVPDIKRSGERIVVTLVSQ